jgi:hypothetical protein
MRPKQTVARQHHQRTTAGSIQHTHRCPLIIHAQKRAAGTPAGKNQPCHGPIHQQPNVRVMPSSSYMYAPLHPTTKCSNTACAGHMPLALALQNSSTMQQAMCRHSNSLGWALHPTNNGSRPCRKPSCRKQGRSLGHQAASAVVAHGLCGCVRCLGTAVEDLVLCLVQLQWQKQ